MAPVRFFSLLALSSLAVITSSITPVTAVSHAQPHAARGHDAIAKRKRSGTVKRSCKPRAPTTSPEASVPVVPEPSKSVASPAPEPTPSKEPEQPTTPSTPVYNGGAKRGISWDIGDDPSIKFWKSDKTKWVYTWSPYYPKDTKKLNLVPMPMFWGAKQRNDFVKQVVNGPDDYADYVLGFNEPDHGEQSFMSPGDAVGLWMELINPLKDRNYKLISPAVTSGGAGTTWLKSFMDGCTKCHFDGLAVHWYGTKAQAMIDFVEERYKTYGLPIYITEFACQDFGPDNKQCSADEVKTFLKTILAYADSKDYIQAVIPFGVLHNMNNVAYTNQLMAGSGEANALGKMFLYE